MAAERFDRYGFAAGDLEEARRFVEERLGLRLRERDSSYRGLYYALRLPDDSGIKLYANAGETHASRPAAYAVLLELSHLVDMDAAQSKLLLPPSKAVLLRSRVIEVPDDDDAEDDADDA